MVSASRQHTPSVRSFSRSSSRPPLEDWVPPLKSTVIFLRQTRGRRGSPAAAAVRKASSLARLAYMRIFWNPLMPQRFMAWARGFPAGRLSRAR
jgi:hypothetical protein